MLPRPRVFPRQFRLRLRGVRRAQGITKSYISRLPFSGQVQHTDEPPREGMTLSVKRVRGDKMPRTNRVSRLGSVDVRALLRRLVHISGVGAGRYTC